MKRSLIWSIILLGWLNQASAVTNPAPGFFVQRPGTDVRSIINFTVTTLLGILGLVSMVFIIIGGYQYVMSGANEELAEKGKKTLRNAIIGLVIAILSYVVVKVVATTLGAT